MEFTLASVAYVDTDSEIIYNMQLTVKNDTSDKVMGFDVKFNINLFIENTVSI